MDRKLECRHCGTFNTAGTVCMCRSLGPPIDKDAPGWRRIETAPEGKRILLFENPLYGDQSIEVGIVLRNGDGSAIAYINDRCARATHWMNLPHRPIDV